jgi:hypothetical protein
MHTSYILYLDIENQDKLIIKLIELLFSSNNQYVALYNFICIIYKFKEEHPPKPII